MVKTNPLTGKVCLISWSLPPEPTGSAVIVGNLAKQFSTDEMVLVGEKPCERPSIAWREEWPKLQHIGIGLPSSWRGGRWWRRLQIPLMFLRSVQLVRKSRCSVLLVIFPNEDYLLVGYLTALWTQLPLFLYFHNTYLENRRGLSFRFARWLQGHAFARAQHVFVMSDGMMQLYRNRYPTLDCSVLLHSFNEDIPIFDNPPEPHSPLRLVICGNINESCREATLRFCDALAEMKNVQLTILSGTPREEIEELGLLRNWTRYDSVSRDQVLSRLADADIVVLPHGFTGKCAAEEYHTMFPTKTIEYLISGRPILAHTPPDCFLTTFLRQHGCALIVDEPTSTALIAAVERLRNDADLRRSLVSRALLAARLFHAPVVACHLRDEIGLR